MTTYDNRLKALLHSARQIAQPSADTSLPALFLFTDPQRTPDPEAIAAHMPAGSGIIYRHFGAADRFERAHRLHAIATERDLTLLIGEDEDLAVSISADGLHLREASLDRASDLRARHQDWLLTAACHSLTTARSVTPDMGLNALFASPVFASNSASATGKPLLGPDSLRAMVEASLVPVCGLGGITADNIPELHATGIAGIGAVEAFLV